MNKLTLLKISLFALFPLFTPSFITLQAGHKKGVMKSPEEKNIDVLQTKIENYTAKYFYTNKEKLTNKITQLKSNPQQFGQALYKIVIDNIKDTGKCVWLIENWTVASENLTEEHWATLLCLAMTKNRNLINLIEQKGIECIRQENNYLNISDKDFLKTLYNTDSQITEFPALQAAMQSQRKELVERALNNGAQIRTEEGFNTQLLELALLNPSYIVVKKYLKEGFDPKEKIGEQKLPLLSVAHNPEIIQLVINYGGDVDSKNGSQTPLYYHINNTIRVSQDMITTFAENNCSINSNEAKKFEVLLMAKELHDAYENNTVKKLIKNNINSPAKTQLWYKMACNSGNTELLKLLYTGSKENGTPLNDFDKFVEFMDNSVKKTSENRPALLTLLRAGWPLSAYKTQELLEDKKSQNLYDLKSQEHLKYLNNLNYMCSDDLADLNIFYN